MYEFLCPYDTFNHADLTLCTVSKATFRVERAFFLSRAIKFVNLYTRKKSNFLYALRSIAFYFLIFLQMNMNVRRIVQPSFQRMPSRRAQRRVVEGQEMVSGFQEGSNVGQGSNVQSSNCLAHGGNGSGGTVASRNNPSPRSTRSAPWTQTRPHGLYTSSSPRSVRSCVTSSSVSFSNVTSSTLQRFYTYNF